MRHGEAFPRKRRNRGKLLAGWIVIASAAGFLGTQLDLDGPPHPATTGDVVYLGLFLASLVVAFPIGAALRRHRVVDLLWIAAVMTAVQEFWYVLIMATSADATADTRAAAFFVMSVAPLYGLLLGLLAAGLGLGRVVPRRRGGDVR